MDKSRFSHEMRDQLHPPPEGEYAQWRDNGVTPAFVSKPHHCVMHHYTSLPTTLHALGAVLLVALSLAAGCEVGLNLDAGTSFDATNFDAGGMADASVPDAFDSDGNVADADQVPFPDAGLGIACADPCTGVLELGVNRAVIQVTLTRNGPARISYGTTEALDQATDGEYSSTWGSVETPHRQRLESLAADTTYYYRVDTLDEMDEWVAISPTYEFRTRDIISGGVFPNEDLPLGGLMYGMPKASSYGAANAPSAVEHAIAFRAQKSQIIDRVMWQNRRLEDTDIPARCARQPGSRWCDCLDAGFDQFECGWLGGMYSYGNGGRYRVGIYPDDGSGEPNEDAEHFGIMDELHNPFDYSTYAWVEHALVDTRPLVAGQVYHLVFLNESPPERRPYAADVTRATIRAENGGGWLTSGGAMCLNGTIMPAYDQLGRRGVDSSGPFYGRRGAQLLRRNTVGGNWTNERSVLPWYGVRYGDGTWQEDAWHMPYGTRDVGMANGALFENNLAFVDGINRGRQRILVQDTSRTVDGLWMHFGHMSRGVNGQPMRVEIKSEDGTVLATASYDSDPTVATTAAAAAAAGAHFDRMAGVWAFDELSSTITLELGQVYYLELSAPAGAGFHVRAPAHHYPQRPNSADDSWRNINILGTTRGAAHESYAQRSTDNGRSWERLDQVHGYIEQDFPHLFTHPGLPRQLE